MAIAFVRSVTVEAGSTTTSLTLAGVTVGNLLVVSTAAWCSAESSFPSGITSSPAATFTKDAQGLFGSTSATVAEGQQTTIWSAIAVTAGNTTVTVTWPVVAYSQVTLSEYSGIASSSPLDKIAATGGSTLTTSPSSASTQTTTQADELVVAVFGASSSINPSTLDIVVPAGYTNRYTVNNGYDFCAICAVDKTVAATGIQTASYAHATDEAGGWSEAIATYKAVGGAIEGTATAVTSGTSGTPQALALVSGTAAATSTGLTGALTGSGALSGNSNALSTGTTGAGTALALVAGTSAAASTGISGTLVGNGALSGTSAALSTGTTGTGQAIGPLNGTSAALTNANAAASGAVVLTGTSATLSTGSSGTLTGKGALSSTTTALSTGITGTLNGIGVLAGTSAALSTGTNGTGTTTAALSGTSNALTTTNGAITGSGAIVGFSNAASNSVGSASGNQTSAGQTLGVAANVTAGAVTGTIDATAGSVAVGATTLLATGTASGQYQSIHAGTITAANGNLLPGAVSIEANAISNLASGETLIASTSYLAGQPLPLQNGLLTGLIFVNATLFVAGSVEIGAFYQPREKVKPTISLSSRSVASIQFKSINSSSLSSNSNISASLTSQ